MNVFHQKGWNSDFNRVSKLFFPIMPYGLVFSKFANWPSISSLNELKPTHVQSFLSHNICFVLQKGSRGEKSFSRLYEPKVFLQGEVNTRAGSWHDFYNALVWYAFPKIKSILNMRQFIAYDERCSFPWKNPLPTRTREQDLLTMFDEGGCILVHFKGEQKKSIPFLFGHGFYERIYYGDKDLSACTLEIELDQDWAEFLSSRGEPIGEESMSSRGEPIGEFLSSRGEPIGEFLSSRGEPIGDAAGTNLKSLLFKIDEAVSQILFHRSYYTRPNAFRSVSLREMEKLFE